MNSYPQRAHHLVEETKKELEINLIITIIRMTLEFIDLTEISLMIKKRDTFNNYTGMTNVNKGHPGPSRSNGHPSYIRYFIHSFNKHLLKILLCSVLKEL